MVNQLRRRSIRLAFSGLGVWLGACTADTKSMQTQADDPDAELKRKFHGIYGGELRVDASFVTHKSVLYTPEGKIFNIGQGSFGPQNPSRSGYGGRENGDRLVIPKFLRYMRYPEHAVPVLHTSAATDYPAFEGKPLIDIKVPVASRIPDDVLERVRKYKGSSLALRLRITPETVLVGWEIKLGRGYPFEKDKAGNNIVTNEAMMVGGDFWPAQPIWELQPNGYISMVQKKGWQVDPKTGKRIETDF